MSRALAIATAILTISLSYVSAQTPTCLPGYDWTFNSLGESPCNMTIALADVCSVLGLAQLGPMGGGYDTHAGNPCTCSTVFYSLLCACTYCQNNTFQNWSVYDRTCTLVYDQIFPSPIPSSIVVPHYAYLDVVADDTFDITAAMSAGGPETTPVPKSTIAATTSEATSTNPTSVASTPSSTSIPTSFTSTPTSVTSTPTTSTASTPNPVAATSNTGAIVGGVVAGIAIIVAGLIAFLFLRRHKPLKLTPSTNTAPRTIMSGPGLA